MSDSDNRPCCIGGKGLENFAWTSFYSHFISGENAMDDVGGYASDLAEKVTQAVHSEHPPEIFAACSAD